MGIRRRNTPFFMYGYGAAILYALIIVVPIYFVFVSAFKENASIFGSPLSLPSSWNVANFQTAQDRVGMLESMRRSVQIAAGAEVLTLLFSFPAAYAIARIQLRIARWIELVFAAGLLVPTFALLVPVFLLSVDLGLLYEPIYLIVFYSAARLSFSVIVLSSHMRDIPMELEEAAMIDGASRFQIITRIIFPLTQSGIATVAVLNFIEFWNEYLFALILLPPNYFTVQLAIPLLRSDRLVDYGLIASGVVMAVIPIYMVFVVFQERIVSNMMSGSVKA